MLNTYQWILFVGFCENFETAQEMGICLFTLQGLELKHGRIKLSEIKTLIAHTRPAEVYYDRFHTPKLLLNYFKAINIQKHSIYRSTENSLLVKRAFPELVNLSKDTSIAVSLLIAHL